MRFRHVVLPAVSLLFSAAAFAQQQTQTTPAAGLLRPANPNLFGQIDFGGRVSGIDGDEARYQRFRDLRDGAFVNIPMFHRETERWVVDAQAWNAGYRDQRFQVGLQQPGRFRVTFLYDQTPTFVSSTTRTPYTPIPNNEDGTFEGSVLDLPDAVQAGIQAGTVNFRNAMENLATNPFNSRYRRDTVALQAGITLTDAWDATFRFQNIRKKGNMPYGASFAFNLAVEVPLEIDSVTNEWGAGLSWSNPRGLVRVAFDASNYRNENQTLIWDSPVKFTDSTNPTAYVAGNGTSRGRMSLWPTNNAYTVSTAAVYRFNRRTSLNGTFAWSMLDQDEQLLPHTINTAIPVIPLARTTAQAEGTSANATVNFVTRSLGLFDLRARYRLANFDNTTTPFNLEQAGGSEAEYVRFDQVVEPFTNPETNKFGPELFGYTRHYADVDADFTQIPFSTINVGYGLYRLNPHFRVYEHFTENVFRVGYDVTGHSMVTVRAQYEFGRRRGEDFHDANGNAYPDLLEGAGEVPTMRHFDVAERDRNRFTLSASLLPFDRLGLNAAVSWQKDDFNDEGIPEENQLGLRDYTTNTASVGADFTIADGVVASAGYSVDRLSGFQRNRFANSFQEQLDPRRNWSVDEDQDGQAFDLGLDVLQGIPRSELRLQYSLNDYNGRYLYTIGPGYLPPAGTTVWPSQLPEITSREHLLRVDYRYFLRRNLAVGFMYWFNDFEVEDWAFSPTVISGIAVPPVRPEQVTQPAVSALLLTYRYRPYNAHTGWLRFTYLF